MAIGKGDARELAISYQEYMSAQRNADWSGIRKWGSALYVVQNKTDIHLIPTDRLKISIDQANRIGTDLVRE